MRQQICILLKYDGKNYFTNKKNLNYIMEFVNKFNAELFFAKTNSSNVLSLEQLAKKLCDQTYQSPEDFKILKSNVAKNKDTRSNITTKAKKIRNKMTEFILKKKIISFKQIQKKFEKENISVSALANHFTFVRHELASKGIILKKIKNGLYSI
jgi:hypothetical protein